MGDTVVKHRAQKVRSLYEGKLLAGFAGATADAAYWLGKDGWQTNGYYFDAEMPTAGPRDLIVEVCTSEGMECEPVGGLAAGQPGGVPVFRCRG